MNHRSPASIKFFENLKEVGTLISMFRANAPTSRDKLINQCLPRSSILLLCSHIESFFEDLIVDIIDFHERNQTPVAKLPVKLKSIQTLRKPLIDSLSLEKKWQIITSISQSSFTDESQLCTQGMFNSDLHTKGFASPGSTAVESLFDGIGISKIWNLIEETDSSINLKRSLNVFIERRNGITHGASSDKPTIKDVKNYICDICQIVRIFNLIITEYLVNEFEITDPWQIFL
jgi:hypothetical protein